MTGGFHSTRPTTSNPRAAVTASCVGSYPARHLDASSSSTETSTTSRSCPPSVSSGYVLAQKDLPPPVPNVLVKSMSARARLNGSASFPPPGPGPFRGPSLLNQPLIRERTVRTLATLTSPPSTATRWSQRPLSLSRTDAFEATELSGLDQSGPRTPSCLEFGSTCRESAVLGLGLEAARLVHRSIRDDACSHRVGLPE